MSIQKTIDAVISDNDSKVRDLKYNGELNPNAITSDGDSVLHLAIAKDSTISFILMDSGADVNYQNRAGDTSLHIAAGINVYDRIAKRLLAKGGDLNVQNKKGETPIHIAAEKSPFHVLSYLTRTKTKPNLGIKDQKGFTALHTLCCKPLDKVKHAKTLLKLGADVNSQDKAGKTALIRILETIENARISDWYSEGHNGDRYVEYKLKNGLFTYHVNKEKRSFPLKDQRYCAEKSWGPTGQTLYYDAIEIALNIIKAQPDLSIVDQEGNSPFLLACRIGEPRIIKALLKGGTATNIPNNSGELPLHAIARSGRLDAVKIFFKQVDIQDINEIDAAGWTALHHLVDTEDDLDILKFLQKKGVDPNRASIAKKESFPIGTLALNIAQAKDRINILPLLDTKKTTFSIDEIRQAALNNLGAVVEKYLKNGGDADMKDANNTTSILLSVARNDNASDKTAAMVQLLLKYGADINALQARYFNALMLCINSLYHKGARILAFDNEYMEHVKIAKILINNGIDLGQAKQGANQKALRDAAEISPEITSMIVQKLVTDYPNYKEELDHQDSDGFTALHVAARAGNVPTIQLLVEAGASINLAEDYGFIPLHEAIIAGHYDASRYLIEQGADIKHTISRGYDAYRSGDDAKAIANKSRNKKILDLF
ncbi:ankyrin repeat domain-containing protein [Aureispira anguillae]|uniref:Ankyrin repeat domain-containing protein n=1 Tax=Aureispira anguillae TaxID=2864201 RepID=A0A916DW30_9BACT|nr:ankyrin repeat domain-containing protein [Aureispira anguillae]BDS14230.1 ankyrin repeat domain-containing protein [Aureispira anguillae]